jgi:hypothetical protein
MLGSEGPVMKVIVIDSTGHRLRAGELGRRFLECSWVHKYSDTYYSTVETRKNVYATSASPTGPWEYCGVILSPQIGCTNHHSIVEY